MTASEIEIDLPNGAKAVHVIIDNGDGSFTSMTKAHYDELQVQTAQTFPSTLS